MLRSISRSRRERSKIRAREESRQRGRFEPWQVRGVLLATLLWLAVLVLLHGGTDLQYGLLAAGEKAPATVVSRTDFQYPDTVRTEADRQRMASAVLPVFTVDLSSCNAACESLGGLFGLLTSPATPDGMPPSRQQVEQSLTAALSALGVPLTADRLLQMVPLGREQEILGILRDIVRATWAEGIVSTTERDTLFHGVAPSGIVSVKSSPDAASMPRKVAELRSPEEAAKTAADALKLALAGRPRLASDDIVALVRPWAMPNLKHDGVQTEALRSDARARVRTVMTPVAAGTTLVEAGERLTASAVDQIRAYERRLRDLETATDRLLRVIGEAGLLVVALIACAGLLHLIRPEALRSSAQVMLMVVLALLTLITSRGIVHLSADAGVVPPQVLKFFLPLGLTPLLGSILLNAPVAVVLGLWTSFVAAMLLGHSFAVFGIGLLVTIVVVQAAKEIHRRSRVFRVGLWIGGAELLCAAAFAVLDRQAPSILAAQAAAGLLNGMLCAVLTLLLIPLFEWLFSITTDITLLELSDMGHPILQRLAMEAPGTYHHSIMVANLASAAAQEIGANDLLVRVGAYYHDIGKLTKPEFFTENAQFRENPHDDLAPSMSTLVITSHVKEGVTMGLQQKLPRIILDAIQQHHGTGLVSYFYHRARKQQEAGQSAGGTKDGTTVSEMDFRYPGPRPASREMAILALADSVEAASRSMDRPTPSRIESLVHEVVDGKVEDGQLDRCDLTLAELAAIKRSFIFTLTNMMHSRIAYPQPDEDRGKQQAARPPGAPPEDQAPPAVDSGTDAAS